MYRVRGEVIDVYPAESEQEAVRIELFDDEVENLSYFDPLTGEVLRRVPRLTIYPMGRRFMIIPVAWSCPDLSIPIPTIRKPE